MSGSSGASGASYLAVQVFGRGSGIGQLWRAIMCNLAEYLSVKVNSLMLSSSKWDRDLNADAFSRPKAVARGILIFFATGILWGPVLLALQAWRYWAVMGHWIVSTPHAPTLYKSDAIYQVLQDCSRLVGIIGVLLWFPALLGGLYLYVAGSPRWRIVSTVGCLCLIALFLWCFWDPGGIIRWETDSIFE